jgi:hypothetical protein
VDFADDFEAVAFVEGDVAGVGGFEVGGEAVAVNAFEGSFEQGAAEAEAAGVGVDAEDGEVPVGFGGVKLGHVFHHRAHVRPSIGGDPFLHESAHGFEVGVDAGGEPKGGAGEVVDDPGGAVVEGRAAEVAHHFPHGIEIERRGRHDVAVERIGDEGGDDGGESFVAVIGLGEADGGGGIGHGVLSEWRAGEWVAAIRYKGRKGKGQGSAREGRKGMRCPGAAGALL